MVCPILIYKRSSGLRAVGEAAYCVGEYLGWEMVNTSSKQQHREALSATSAGFPRVQGTFFDFIRANSTRYGSSRPKLQQRRLGLSVFLLMKPFRAFFAIASCPSLSTRRFTILPRLTAAFPTCVSGLPCRSLMNCLRTGTSHRRDFKCQGLAGSKNY